MLLNEDYLTTIDYLNQLNKKVNLIITSPPYFGLRNYGNETIGREENPNDYVDNLVEGLNKLKSILADDGSFYLNVGDVYFGTKGFSRNSGKYKRETDLHYKTHKICKEDKFYLQHKQLLMLPERIAIGLQNKGWIVRNKIIWNKPNAMPSTSKDRRLPTYETIYHLVKSKHYYFNKCYLGKNKRDIITIPIKPFGKHKATFPEELIEPFILTSSKEEDLVYDPFMGSGTTALVAIKNNRNWIGSEINKDYCDIAEERIKTLDKNNELDYTIY